MARFKKVVRKAVLQLVSDCMIYNFDNAQTRLYIKERLPEAADISNTELDRIRRGLRSQPALQYWLSNQVKVGFLVQHKELIEEATLVKNMLWEMVHKERNKELAARNDAKLIKLLSMVMICNHRVAELNMASPIVAQMKAYIDLAMQRGQQPILPVPTNPMEQSLQLMYNPEKMPKEQNQAVIESISAVEGDFGSDNAEPSIGDAGQGPSDNNSGDSNATG